MKAETGATILFGVVMTAVLLVVVFHDAPGAMFCGIDYWLNRYQTLLVGLLSLSAAIGGAFLLWRQVGENRKQSGAVVYQIYQAKHRRVVDQFLAIRSLISIIRRLREFEQSPDFKGAARIEDLFQNAEQVMAEFEALSAAEKPGKTRSTGIAATVFCRAFLRDYSAWLAEVKKDFGMRIEFFGMRKDHYDNMMQKFVELINSLQVDRRALDERIASIEEKIGQP